MERWQAAGVIDDMTVGRIRAFEAAEERPAGHRWQVLVALIFGGILLAAGILLFVAAHWDEVSPGVRLGIVVALLAVLHGGAILAAERFPAMSTALHGVGTVACGGAIAVVGQIFNMQEHWPAAVLLWAACATAGWWWLRDQFQQVCLLLLLPAWLICEWQYRANMYRGSDVYLFRMIAVLAAIYLTAWLHSRRRAVFGVLFAFASVALIVTTVLLSEGWTDGWRDVVALPWPLKAAAFTFMGLMLAATWFMERRSFVPVLAISVMTLVLPWLRATVIEENGTSRRWTHSEPSVWLYIVVALLAAFLAWWGVRERSRAVVNYGIVTFGLAVMWFYFSSLMDKFGRSLGLIGLGLLFLLGGYGLERMRRRLLLEVKAGEPA